MRSMGSVGLRSDPRQHPFAEGAHCGDDRFFVWALEIEIDRANAEIAQRSDIVDELGVAAGEQLLLPIGYQASPRRAARRSDGPLSPPTQIGGYGRCTGFGSSNSRS